jgi:hypothetical protein
LTGGRPRSVKELVEQRKPGAKVSAATLGWSLLHRLLVFVMLALVGVLLGSGGVLIWQAYRWLKDGAWVPMPVSQLFEYSEVPHPDVAWRGLQKILDVVLEFPLGLTGIVISVFGMSIVAILLEAVEARSERTV